MKYYISYKILLKIRKSVTWILVSYLMQSIIEEEENILNIHI